MRRVAAIGVGLYELQVDRVVSRWETLPIAWRQRALVRR